jgi:hypothetical protein
VSEISTLNQAAVAVLRLGHIPVIGVNAALPVVALLGAGWNSYEAIMAISLALMDKCDALLILGESPGVRRERELVESKGLPVYYDLTEIPAAASAADAT